MPNPNHDDDEDILQSVYRLIDDSDPVEDEISSTAKLDCPMCGSIGTVTKNEDNVHVNEELMLKIEVPALICGECNHKAYESKHFKFLLETEEAAKGHHWVRFEVKRGQFTKYSVH